MSLDVERFTDALLAGTRALIAKEMAPLRAESAALRAENAALILRLAAVEGRAIPEAFDAAPLEARVKALADAVAAIPEPQEPHELPPLPDVPALVSAAVEAASDALEAKAAARIAEMPQPKDFGPEIEEIRAAIKSLPEPAPLPDLSGFATKEALAEVAKSIPTDLSHFATKAEVAAIKMPEAIPGKDGAGLAEARQNEDGELILKMTTGETINVGKVRGADGFGFDDLTVEDGEREFTLVFAKDDRVERKTLAKPAIIDRGVWRDGEFKAGDAVTWAGSLWIAQRDTTDKPETSDAWRLAVKRGRDGKNLTPPEPKGPVKR